MCVCVVTMILIQRVHSAEVGALVPGFKKSATEPEPNLD